MLIFIQFVKKLKVLLNNITKEYSDIFLLKTDVIGSNRVHIHNYH